MLSIKILSFNVTGIPSTSRLWLFALAGPAVPGFGEYTLVEPKSVRLQIFPGDAFPLPQPPEPNFRIFGQSLQIKPVAKPQNTLVRQPGWWYVTPSA